MEGYSDGSSAKPINPGQLFLKDIRKLEPNTELVMHLQPNGAVHHVNERKGFRLAHEDVNVPAMAVQFIHAKIIVGEEDRRWWHAKVRNLHGEAFYIDLGNYGAVCWEGTWATLRWLTLKDNEV